VKSQKRTIIALAAVLTALLSLRLYDDFRQAALFKDYARMPVESIDKKTADSLCNLLKGKTRLDLSFFPIEENSTTNKTYIPIGKGYSCYCQDAISLEFSGPIVTSARRVSCIRDSTGLAE